MYIHSLAPLTSYPTTPFSARNKLSLVPRPPLFQFLHSVKTGRRKAYCKQSKTGRRKAYCKQSKTGRRKAYCKQSKTGRREGLL